MKSKVAVLVKPGEFRIEEREITCAPDEVIVKVACVGLCNWEKGFFTGVLPGAPCTLGHEWSGVVVECGSEVKTLKVNDKVSILPDRLCGFAEYAPIKESFCFKLADHIDVYRGFSEPLKCVVTTIRSAQVEVGDYGVVIGCGPMGLWCIQALAGKTLAGLIAIDVDDMKLEKAKKFGATQVINTAREDAEKIICELTGGHMADFVIEGTGLPQLVPTISKLIRTCRARVVLMSYYEQNLKEFDFRPFADKGAIVTNPQPAFSQDNHDDGRRAVALINNGTFDQTDIVTHKFMLDDIQTAFETLVRKPKGYIKGVVICNDDL